MKGITAVRGMQDFLPDKVEKWVSLEKKLIDNIQLYGYQEIRFPILEKTALFNRSIGEATDIVEKEMYSFKDHNEELTLRPEGTASTVRFGLEHGLLHNQKQRFFYYGPMFRHERPQKGRYRQFHQFGVEAFGFSGIEVETEQLLAIWRWWQILGISSKMVLELNSIGEIEERFKYREILVEYFNKYLDVLDENMKIRLEKNPLRLLDSKVPEMQNLIENAPKISNYLSSFSLNRLENLMKVLSELNIPFVVNQRLVRGLDYYNQTVFEWKLIDDRQQNTVCAGGRYDRLVEEMGGKATPACGFAIGMERLLDLISFGDISLQNIIFLGSDSFEKLPWKVIEELRNLGYDVVTEIVKAGNLYKRSFSNKAHMAVFVGQENCKIINLQSKEEEIISMTELVKYFEQRVKL